MQSSYLFANNLRIHYLHWGIENTGLPVVLLHGLSSNARIWEMVAPYLVDSNLIIYAPDARGHGLTDKPENGYGFDSFQSDLLAFFDLCNIEHPILVGHSWGGLLALDFAARFTAGPRAPSGVVLVDGGMTQLDDFGVSWEQMRDRLTPPRLAGTPVDLFTARLERGWLNYKPDESAISIILANFEVNEDETIYPRLTFEHHMQIVRAMWEFQTYERMSRVRCPILCVPAQPPDSASQEDKEYLESKKRGIAIVQQKNANLSVHWMVDSIHDLPLQRPAELAGVILEFTESVK